MTANEKGRFCNSCAKTVVDFTQMNTQEIQGFLHENRNNCICGHIRQEQLDAINIQIPYESFSSEMNFNRLFLLALLIAMGTTLLNCTNTNDKIQKIESVEIVDSLNSKFEMSNSIKKTDSLLIEVSLGNIKNDAQTEILIEETDVKGEIVEVSGFIISQIDENAPIAFVHVENPPEFKDTPQTLSVKEKRNFFKDKLTEFVSDNFAGPQICLNIYGVHRIQSQFVIDSLGFAKDIKVRASYEPLEYEAKRVLKLLPQFIPAKQNGKNVSVVYNLPIVFQVEE